MTKVSLIAWLLKIWRAGAKGEPSFERVDRELGTYHGCARDEEGLYDGTNQSCEHGLEVCEGGPKVNSVDCRIKFLGLTADEGSSEEEVEVALLPSLRKRSERDGQFRLNMTPGFLDDNPLSCRTSG